MKKILISIMIIAVVAAIAIGGTVAYFQATSNDLGAAFRTASVELQASGNAAGDPAYTAFNVYDMIPGQHFQQDIAVKNAGTADLRVTANFAPSGGNLAIDHDMTPPVVVNWVNATKVSDYVYDIKAGQTATFTVQMQFRETGVDQSALAGSYITYKANFVGRTVAP